MRILIRFANVNRKFNRRYTRALLFINLIKSAVNLSRHQFQYTYLSKILIRKQVKTWQNTCLNPGTSPTAVPSERTQMISGCGFPLAWHSTTAPVPFEKSIRFGGSLTNTGPIDASSAETTVSRIQKFQLIMHEHILLRQLSYSKSTILKHYKFRY